MGFPVCVDERIRDELDLVKGDEDLVCQIEHGAQGRWGVRHVRDERGRLGPHVREADLCARRVEEALELLDEVIEHGIGGPISRRGREEAAAELVHWKQDGLGKLCELNRVRERSGDDYGTR